MNLSPLSKYFPFLLQLLQVFKLFWFSCCFIVVSTIALPIIVKVQFLAVHSLGKQLCFLPLLAQVHHLARIVMLAIVGLLKQIPSSVPDRSKYFHHQDAHFQIVCAACYILQAQWFILRIILLSGDIELNPGPETLDFCCWNLNSIFAYDFLRVPLIKAYNSIYNYDLIGIVETHLDSTIDECRLSLDGYSLHKSNHPQKVKRGGVGLYVKDSLPSKNHLDLVTLSECIVCELQVNRRKYFFVVIYESPSQDQSEFNNFTTNFELMVSKLLAENPHCMIITGDFNCRSTQWWENDIENSEGKLFEQITADNGLHQLISEPTHIVGGSKSCIDLIFTDQPNLIVDTGVHPSLHDQCYHQIVHEKLSVSNISQPPYARRVWHYDKADFVAIRKSIEMFTWREHLGKIICPNEQVKLLNEVLLNISFQIK